MKLTDRSVHGFPLIANGRQEYADDAVAGLSVRVGKTAKVFRLVSGTGKHRKRFTLGTYDPPQFTLAMAREKARDIIAAERLARDQGLPRTTFEEALNVYYRVHVPTLRAASGRCVRQAIDRNFRPQLAKRFLTDIKRSDIAPLLDRLIETPSLRETAFRYLRAFLNWCVKRGYIENAPTDRMETPPRPQSRSRVLFPDELVAAWRAAPETDYGSILKLCILSGQRRGQWAAVQREYIRGDTVVFPASLMKAGKEHILPLTPTLRSLLPDRIGYLFPNSSGKPFDNWTRNKDRLAGGSGVQDFRLHDFRRTWATICAEELDVQPHVIESVLAHATGSQVARIYNRARYQEQMRKSLLAFEEWLQTQLAKSEDDHERRQLR